MLLRAVMKHGYGRWQAIVDDKDLRLQEVICQELNLPLMNTPVPGQNISSGTSQTQSSASASGVSQTTGVSQPQNGVNSEHHVEAPRSQPKGTSAATNDIGADAAHGSTDATGRPQLFQDQSMLFHFRETQRRLVEFVKKRVLLFEKGLNAEYQKEYYASPFQM